MPRRLRSTICALLLAAVGLGPGCIIGSPVAAVSGEPYGMTIDDAHAIGGDQRPIWGGHPVLAAIDIPFAAVLDTAFLPISLIVWGISALAGGGEDEGHHGHRHDANGNDVDDYGGRDRTHAPAADDDDDDEAAPHTHADGTTHSHAHADGTTHSHE